MTLNSIDVKHLKSKYDDNQDNYTLSDLSFYVKQGEQLSIIGYNGSGKSTTVRLIDGLLVAESGDIFVESELSTEENVWNTRQKIGVAFQNPDNQLVGVAAEDDVAFGLKDKGTPLEKIQSHVREALQLVRMSNSADREPLYLSGGQKQHITIAGATAMRPNIIILDGATSMLDPEGRLELIQAVKEIRDQYSMTVISTTHDLDEVALSDHVLVMKRGKVGSSSIPREFFARGEELLMLGLNVPFPANPISILKNKRLELTENYLTERELEDQLWELLLKA